VNRTSVVALSLALGLLAPSLDVPAQEAQDAQDKQVLEEVVVSGEQPGPGLWQVTNGANTLWVLGTHSPLPRDMKWQAREVESIIARSALVIAPPDVEVDADIGFFGALRLMPAALRARAIPDDKTLSDVLPPDLHARWTTLKNRYPSPRKIERWRPAIAGFTLYGEALDASRLTANDVVWPTVEKMAKRGDVKIRRPNVKLEIKDVKGLIKDFTETDISGEIGCFEGLVTRMESDLPRLKAQANAWATGDIAGLRDIKSDELQARCIEALTGAPKLAAMIEEARRKFRLEVLLAWEGALQRDANALAVLPVDELFSDSGPLQELRRRGYVVIEPR